MEKVNINFLISSSDFMKFSHQFISYLKFLTFFSIVSAICFLERGGAERRGEEERRWKKRRGEEVGGQ